MGRHGTGRLGQLLAALVLTAVILPVPPAGAAGAKTAGPSPKQMAKQVRNLQQQAAALVDKVSALRAKTAKLEAAPSSSSPFLGPAGGDLIGSYPGPQLRAGAIVGSDLADGAIVTRHVVPNSFSGSHFLDNTIGSAAIGDGAIGRSDLSTSPAGGPQLGEVFIERRNVSRVVGRTPVVRVTCPSGTRVVGGGVEVEPGPPAPVDSMTVTKSVPAEDAPNTTWEVQVFLVPEIDGGFPERDIIVKAICLRGS